VPIPRKIAAVFFPEESAPVLKQAEPPRRAASQPAPAPVLTAPVQTVEKKEPGDSWLRQPGPWRRLFMAERLIEARRAMGLPTQDAERIERQLRRRAEMWRAASPDERARWLERRQARRETRQAMLATPEGQAALAAQREQMRRWRAQRLAGIPLTPEQHVERQQLMRQWRAQGIGPPSGPEQHWARQERMRAWRGQGPAGQPPLTEEQRAFRQERFRRWRDMRRPGWEARQGQAGEGLETGAEESDPPARR
jgi:hypothetical protein